MIPQTSALIITNSSNVSEIAHVSLCPSAIANRSSDIFLGNLEKDASVGNQGAETSIRTGLFMPSLYLRHLPES